MSLNRVESADFAWELSDAEYQRAIDFLGCMSQPAMKNADCPIDEDTVKSICKISPVALGTAAGMTFGDALVYLKQGKGVRLPSWSNDVAIYCQFPDENSKMTAPYLYVESRFGRVPWKETMIELFSESWMVIE